MILSGMTAIRWYSDMNEWMDCVVFVPNNQAEIAKTLIEQAIDLYWEDEYECYGDAIEDLLSENNITYCIQFIEWDHDEDCMVEWFNWEKWIDDLSANCKIIVADA